MNFLIKIQNIFIIILFLIIQNITFAQIFNDNEKEILILQDSRTFGNNNQLLDYLNSKDESIVTRTLTALANIQDTNTVNIIGKMLDNEKSEIRKSAAFTLGQILCNESKIILENALIKEENTKVKCEIINSLGKIGDNNSLEIITSLDIKDDQINSAIALSIGRFAIRGIKTKESIKKLKNILRTDFSDKAENFVAYALFRIRDKELLKQIEEDLILLTKSFSPLTRMWVYTTIAYIGNSENLSILYRNYKNETDWRVKVNMLNSLLIYVKENSMTISDDMASLLLELKDDNNINVRITALKQIGEIFSYLTEENQIKKRVLSELESYFQKGKAYDYYEIGEAVISYSKIKKDEAKEFLLDFLAETNNYSLKPYIIKTFKNITDCSIFKIVKGQISKDVQNYVDEKGMISGNIIQDKVLADIYLAFIELLDSMTDKIDEMYYNDFRLIFTEFLNSKDPRIVELCINSLNKDIFNKYRNETSMVLIYDYENLQYPQDKEIMKLFIEEFGFLNSEGAINILKRNLDFPDYELAKLSSETLKKITGVEYNFFVKPKTFHDWDYINTIFNRKYAIIETTAGKIKIQLYLNEVPFTVNNFIRLASSGYYNGTLFHRIVPNFVVQGGDHTGTGWGGPEYTIRTEIFNCNFETGAVGMASTGKDTEGSQFFIMHSPHYHLDGKYTLFGKVSEGMEIVDRIYIDDKILNITFSDK